MSRIDYSKWDNLDYDSDGNGEEDSNPAQRLTTAASSLANSGSCANVGLSTSEGDATLEGGGMNQMKAFLKQVEAKQKELKLTLEKKQQLAAAAKRLLATNTNTPRQEAHYQSYAKDVQNIEQELAETSVIIQDLRDCVLDKGEQAMDYLIDGSEGCTIAKAAPSDADIIQNGTMDPSELDAFDLDFGLMADATAISDAAEAQHPPESDMLLDAAMKGDRGDICWLVESLKVDPNYANKMNQGALHVAGLWGNVDALEQLLEYGADVNKQNFITGATPLHSITMSGKSKGTDISDLLQCMTLLLDHGADPTLKDLHDKTPVEYCDTSSGRENPLVQKLQPQPPLFKAIEDRDHDTVQKLLQCDGTILTYVGKSPFTYTMDMLLQDQTYALVNILQLLLEEGHKNRLDSASIIATLEGKDDSLHRVCEALEDLYESRQESHQVSQQDAIHALEAACQLLVQYWPSFRQDKGIVKLFHTACRKNKKASVCLCLDLLQLDPSIPSPSNGMTGLHFSARSGCTDMARYLLQRGADATAIDKFGKTALESARTNHKQEVVALLENPPTRVERNIGG